LSGKILRKNQVSSLWDDYWLGLLSVFVRFVVSEKFWLQKFGLLVNELYLVPGQWKFILRVRCF
jgi:hypothetical protein